MTKPKQKRSISDSEFFMITIFLSDYKGEFALHCDGFDSYNKLEIDLLINEVAGPKYTKALKAVTKSWKKQN